ncbi:MAG: flavin reductase family protein [Lewinella sp.]|nr:flavin reductase family protein [Lewinella sp.]
MISIDPKDTPVPQLHQYLVGAVAPRPIAFVSTVDEDGRPNLAPYSFFNVFSSNPATCVFSSNRRVSNGTTKDTLHNVEATGECVINMVNYDMVRQMALCSVEFPAEINEFEMSGLTPVPAELVRPARVEESPVQMECRVKQILPLGDEGGAGHLVICEILRIHLRETILDEEGRIHPQKIDLMGRMGRAFYTRASGESVYTIFQNVRADVIGFSALPASARNSTVLTGNDLGRLASLEAIPSRAAIDEAGKDEVVQAELAGKTPLEGLHRQAQLALAREELPLAAALVWLADTL